MAAFVSAYAALSALSAFANSAFASASDWRLTLILSEAGEDGEKQDDEYFHRETLLQQQRCLAQGDPMMAQVREVASGLDFPVSEVVRRATESWLSPFPNPPQSNWRCALSRSAALAESVISREQPGSDRAAAATSLDRTTESSCEEVEFPPRGAAQIIKRKLFAIIA